MPRGIKGIPKTYLCLHCGKENKFSFSSTNKFCDNKCQKEFEGKEKVKLWLKGDKEPTKSIIVRYLKETKGYKCDVCGLSEWNGSSITLEIDHIDGDSTNNHPSNFRYMCPNCHSQTPTYKGGNKGNGRPRHQKDYTIIRSLS